MRLVLGVAIGYREMRSGVKAAGCVGGVGRGGGQLGGSCDPTCHALQGRWHVDQAGGVCLWFSIWGPLCWLPFLQSEIS
jgi:hypothetical protein